MGQTLDVGGVTLDVLRKDIKNVHLGVYPPTGRVRIAAPRRMSASTIRLFAISKLPWIRKQQRKLQEQERATQLEYLDRESHLVWGSRVLLRVLEEEASPKVQLQGKRLLLRVRPDAGTARREEVVAEWYRGLIREAVPRLLQAWEPRLGVAVRGFYVQQMKTKWGSCNPAAQTIRLNTELAKKPRECLEYIVVHEMTHLVDRTHGPTFLVLMDRYIPAWRETQKLLNRLPARHEHWSY